MDEQNVRVGIDLGTTYSAIAYVDESGTPRVIGDTEGNKSMPSAVLIHGDRIAVGEVALHQWVTNEEHVVRWIKRAMGDLDYCFQGKNPVEISAEILKALKAIAEAELGHAVHEAKITCPAYFNALEIENTRDAGDLAGFHVLEVVKEPTAAAVYHGVQHMRDGQKILVCDLGGGTYDATLLSMENGVFQPWASMGSRELGGHDWTMELVGLVAERFLQLTGDDPRNDLRAGQLLYESCEQAKRHLARAAEVSIACQCYGRTEQLTVTRDEFEAANEWRIQQVVTWSKEALDKATQSLHKTGKLAPDAALTWADLDAILLVGGSSRLLRMALALEEASGKKPQLVNQPDFAVALGAAILAAGKVRVRGGLTDVAQGGLREVVYERILPRNFGIRANSYETGQPTVRNVPILDHGISVPCRRTREDFEVPAHGQQIIEIPVVEFEDEEDFDPIFSLRCECPPNMAKGDRVAVTFDYDESGILTAEATDQKTGQKLTLHHDKYEEPQPPTVKPLWLVYAIDVSWSMEGTKMRNAKKAVKEATRELLSAAVGGCKVALVTFSEHACVECEATDDLQEIHQAVDRMAPEATTAMDKGIRLAFDLVQQAPPDVDREIVLVTDGMPDPSCYDSTLKAAEKVRTSGVTLSVLDFQSDEVDEDYLRQMTDLVYSVRSPEEIGSVLLQLVTQRLSGGLREAQV